MKKLFIVCAMVLSLVMAPMAFAGSDIDNSWSSNSGIQNTGNNNNFGTTSTINGGIHNQGGQGGQGGNADANATAIGVGVGIGGNSTSIATGGTGIGIGGQGGSAVIQRGAVENNNTDLNVNNVNNRNDVEVKNYNTDINNNHQGQNQGQVQGQKQGQMQGQTAHNEGVNQSIVQNYEDNREMTGAAGFTGTGSADYRGPWNAGPQVVKFGTLVKYQKSFKSEVVNKGYSGLFEGVRVRFRPAVDILPAATSEINIGGTDGEFIGFMYAQATGDEADTYLVLQKAMAEAMAKGGSYVELVGEGFTTDTDSFGWGIGLSYTQAYISADQKNSGAGAGGTGISGAKVGPETKPWVQFAVFSK